MLVATAARRRPGARHLHRAARASSTKATWWSSTPRARCRPSSRAPTGRAGAPGPPLDRAAGRPVDGRAAPGRPRRASTPTAGRRRRPGRRRPGRPAHPVRPHPAGGVPAVGGHGRPPRTRSSPTWPSTAGPSATATCEGDWPISMYQNVYATEPGLGRDAQRRPAVHPRGADPAGGPGRGRGPGRAAHRGGLARGLRAPLPRVLPGLGGHRPPGQRHPPAGGRVVAVGTTVVRALETVVDAPGPRPRRERVDRDGDHPRPGRPLGRRPADRLARARGVPPGHARGGRPAGRCSSSRTRRPWRRATCGTSSATSTWCCRDRAGELGPRWPACPTTRRAVL